MKRILVALLALLVAACGSSKLDATYSNNMTGIAEQKVSFIFKPDGTARMSVGSTTLPAEMPYEVSGGKIKVVGQNGDLVFAILENGDLVGEGLRLKKESSSPPRSATMESKAPEAIKPQEKDMAFCRKLAAKARAGKPGEFASEPDFLPSVNHCYKLAKEKGEVLQWTDPEPSSPKDPNFK
jgi:hypothetical protein